MNYNICFCETFQYDLINLPKKTQNSVVKKVQPSLRENPVYGQNIKKLKGYKKLWRYKIDYGHRLIYSIDGDSVIFIKLGPRKDVYESIHYDPDNGQPTIKAVAEVPEMLETEPSAEEYSKALKKVKESKNHENRSSSLDNIELKNLLKNAIPDEYYQTLQQCVSGSDIIRSNIPQKTKEQILHVLNPPSLAEIKKTPQRVLENDEDLFYLANGEITLDSLLLRLDGEQKTFVRKFTKKGKLSGPWLLKGGPGSGKTTIAMHCIKEIIDPQQTEFAFEKKEKVLFATFTNSLVKFSSYFLKQLVRKNEVKFSTMHLLAAEILKKAKQRNEFADEGLRRGIFYLLLDSGKIDSRKTGYYFEDFDFIDKEIEWVIYGNNIKTLDEYLAFDRIMPGKRLGKEQKKILWSIFEIYQGELRRQGRLSPTNIFIKALAFVENCCDGYDFVFLDEVQDLPSIAIKFALKLCKNPKNLFITADINQCIYGMGITWKSIDEQLKFQGKATHLKKNYRSSQEIMKSLSDLMTDLPDSDPETLTDKAIYSGDPPLVAVCKDIEDEVKQIEKFINKCLMDLRMSHESVAILCATNDLAEKISKNFSSKFNAKYLTKYDSIMDHKGLKIITIHSSKGLQFPIVIIPQFTKNNFPTKVNQLSDAKEFDQKQRRVIFVACTRAMKRLMITTIYDQESDYMKYLSDKHWQYI